MWAQVNGQHWSVYWELPNRMNQGNKKPSKLETFFEQTIQEPSQCLQRFIGSAHERQFPAGAQRAD